MFSPPPPHFMWRSIVSIWKLAAFSATLSSAAFSATLLCAQICIGDRRRTWKTILKGKIFSRYFTLLRTEIFFLLTLTTTNQYKFRWLIMKRNDNLAYKKSSLFKMSFKLVKQFSEFFKLLKFLIVLSHKRCKCSQAFSLCYFELKSF